MATKWAFKKSVKLPGDAKLARIIQFYVLETPVFRSSMKGKTFKEYGWSGAAFNTLHKKMREKTGFPKGDRWLQVPKKEIEERLRNLDEWESIDFEAEFAVHTKKKGLNKTENLFRFIRNSFAHGGFRSCIHEGNKYYALENHDAKGVITGRGLIAEQTLLDWSVIVAQGLR